MKTVYTLFLLHFLKLLLAEAQEFYTSVWCHGHHQDHRHCNFRRLCYSGFHDQFIFFLSDSSDLSGIDDPGEQIQLSRLSTVTGLDESYLDFSTVPAKASKDFDIEIIAEPSLLVHRWNSKNLGHVLHDDLIPIFDTAKQICFGDFQSQCWKELQLVVHEVDGRMSDKFDSFYELFFAKLERLRDKNSTEKSLKCFERLYTGLETESCWYDHGLTRINQGPIQSNHQPTLIVEDFRKFVLERLQIFERIEEEESNRIIFLEDDDTSKLVNRDKVIESMEKSGFLVEKLDFEKNSWNEIIRAVAKAKAVVGHHSMNLAAALFLNPKNTGVFEIFPYALDPSNLAFMETLSDLKGIEYGWYVTTDRSLSKSINPNAPPEAGGISHLPEDLRRSIENADTVENVRCDDPAYLYRLNQKSVIDIPAFESNFSAFAEGIAINNFDLFSRSSTIGNEWLLPSKVYDISCSVNKMTNVQNAGEVEIRWRPPLNAEYFSFGRSLAYEILVESLDAGVRSFVQEFSTKDAEVKVTDLNLRKFTTLVIWITPVLDLDIRGNVKMFKCDLIDDPFL